MPTPIAPGMRTRVIMTLADTPGIALSNYSLAKMIGATIAQVDNAVAYLREERMISGKSAALSLTPAGEKYAAYNKDQASKRQGAGHGR